MTYVTNEAAVVCETQSSRTHKSNLETLAWNETKAVRVARVARAVLRAIALLVIWALGLAVALFFTGAAIGQLLMSAFPLPPYSSAEGYNPSAIASVDGLVALMGIGLLGIGVRLAAVSAQEFDSFLIGDRFASAPERLYVRSLWFGLLLGCLLLAQFSGYLL